MIRFGYGWNQILSPSKISKPDIIFFAVPCPKFFFQKNVLYEIFQISKSPPLSYVKNSTYVKNKYNCITLLCIDCKMASYQLKIGMVTYKAQCLDSDSFSYCIQVHLQLWSLSCNGESHLSDILIAKIYSKMSFIEIGKY